MAEAMPKSLLTLESTSEVNPISDMETAGNSGSVVHVVVPQCKTKWKKQSQK